MADWEVELPGVTPTGVPILLRPIRAADRDAYYAIRRAQQDWLSPWDATSPDGAVATRTFRDVVRQLRKEARNGRALPFVIESNGRLIGQMNGSGITLGAFRSMTVGYWVSRTVAGRGIAPTALALLADHAFAHLGLHRVEVNIRPENEASLHVVEKLRFRDEGLRRRMLHINGEWRDHRSFALTTEDLGGLRVMDRLTQQHHQSLPRHTEAGPSA